MEISQPKSRFIDRSRAAVRCSFCTRWIKQFCVKCAECVDVVLCQDCFGAGVVIPPHSPAHGFVVLESLEIGLFSEDWSAKEDLLMLDGLEKYGIGNWKEISTFMESSKKEKQLEDHYWQMFLGRYGVCLPVEYSVDGFGQYRDTVDLFPRDPCRIDGEEEQISDKDQFRIPLPPGKTRGDKVERDAPVSGIQTSEAQAASHRGPRSSSAASVPAQVSDLPGHMPLRDDFETDYENDCEHILASMEFSSEDHPSEIELKYQIIRIYNEKLSEREKRKKFVADRGLVDIKKHQQEEKRFSKEDRDLYGKLRPFARYHSPEEHEALVRGIGRAIRLQQQIEMYQAYRSLGATNLDEVLDYEIKRRSKPGEDHLDCFKELSRGANLAGSVLGKRQASETKAGGKRRVMTQEEEPQPAPSVPDKDNSSTADSNAGQRCPVKIPIHELEQQQGFHLLSAIEAELCARVPLLPLVYLSIKRAVASAHKSRAGLTTAVESMLGTETSAAQVGVVCDFFVKEAPIEH